MWNQYLKKLSHILENATNKFDPHEVGIYLVSFDEVTPILIQFNEHQTLQQIKWYGRRHICTEHADYKKS